MGDTKSMLEGLGAVNSVLYHNHILHTILFTLCVDGDNKPVNLLDILVEKGPTLARIYGSSWIKLVLSTLKTYKFRISGECVAQAKTDRRVKRTLEYCLKSGDLKVQAPCTLCIDFINHLNTKFMHLNIPYPESCRPRPRQLPQTDYSGGGG